MTEQTDIEKKQTSEDEIDLIEVALKIWAERKFILKVVAVFFVLGLVVAFGSKKEYKAETTFILEDNQGGSRMSGMLAQFGGLAGINFGGGESGDILSPELFPNIIHSTSFLVKLARQPVYFEELDATYSLGEYFNKIDKPSFVDHLKGFTIGLPGKIIGLFKKKQPKVEVFQDELLMKIERKEKPIKLSKAEQKIIEKLTDRIVISFDEKTGILNLSSELPDPNAVAELIGLALNDLTDYLIAYQTEKATKDLKFIEEQYANAEERFQKAQDKLAVFRDRNMNVVTARAQTEQQRLQAEYDLSFNIYNGLAQQYEQAKIKVQEKTPVFKLIEVPNIPLSNDSPRKVFVLFSSIILGVIFSICFILLTKVFNIKKIVVK